MQNKAPIVSQQNTQKKGRYVSQEQVITEKTIMRDSRETIEKSEKEIEIDIIEEWIESEVVEIWQRVRH